MATNNHTISIHFVHTVLDCAQYLGLPVDELLKQAKIPSELLKQSRARVQPVQFGKLVHAVGQQGNDEYMGCAREPGKFGIFNLMAKLAVQQATLHQALLSCQQFYRLTGDAIRLEIDIVDQQAKLTLRLIEPCRQEHHLITELTMLIWHRFSSWLIDEAIVLSNIQFTFPQPAYAEEYELMYPGPVLFNMPSNTLIFDQQCLNRPVNQNTHSLRKYLQQVPYQWFVRQRFNQPTTTLVIEQLEAINVERLPDIGRLASMLHMSERTLRRKLQQENTLFSKLRDRIKRDAAIGLLTQHRHSVEQVAAAVGFSESASFIRAFKSWTGVTPAIYRHGNTKTTLNS
ncbi:MAG: AraC family transcriptional regulator [Pseudomonadales bacterium]